jgi:hypothetical protein
MTEPQSEPPPERAEPPTELPPASSPEYASAPAGDPWANERVPAQRSRTALPVLCALGFLLLLAGLGWLYYQQQGIAQALADQAQRLDAEAQRPPPAPAVDPARLTALDARIAALDSRMKGLEQRIATLAQPVAAAPAGPPAASADELQKLQAQVAELQARKPPPPPDTAAAVAPLEQKLESVTAEAAAAKAAATARLAELGDRLKQDEQQQTTIADRTSQASLIARVQVALAAGQPLGDIPNAPPALARFAQAKPPTEAALRLSFPAAADAAEDASRPSVEGKTFGERMWLRARALVTVKRGDTVLVGAPAAAVLAEAHARLQAGDLTGTLSALDNLDGAAAQAMAGWRGQAQALLDARAALSQMARA